MKKFKRWTRIKKIKCEIVVALIMFPILVGLIYALPLPQFVAVDSGDLLSYYGSAFGIIGSFVMYRTEIAKKKKERESELKPQFVVNVTLVDKENGVFVIRIGNYTQKKLYFLNLYDEFVSCDIKKNYEITVTYLKSTEELTHYKLGNKKIDYNINMDPDILDIDGYPKYVQLICDDSSKNTWNCCYYKINDGGKVYYYPREIVLE